MSAYQMKTGIIIRSEDFRETKDGTKFNHVSLVNVFTHGDNWRQSHDASGVSVKDIEHYAELMAEGLACAIQFLHSKGVDTEVNLLHKTKERIDKALFTVAELNEEQMQENFGAGSKMDLE